MQCHLGGQYILLCVNDDEVLTQAKPRLCMVASNKIYTVKYKRIHQYKQNILQDLHLIKLTRNRNRSKYILYAQEGK